MWGGLESARGFSPAPRFVAWTTGGTEVPRGMNPAPQVACA
jgi:hypothetical protein